MQFSLGMVGSSKRGNVVVPQDVSSMDHLAYFRVLRDQRSAVLLEQRGLVSEVRFLWRPR